MRAFKNAIFLALCVFMLSALAPIKLGYAQNMQDGMEINQDELYELVLEVVREKKVLSRALIGFQRGYDEYYLPVGGLTGLLALKADVDLEQGTVTGWYLKESYPFQIDVNNGFYTIRGERVDLQPGDAFVRNLKGGFGDVYVKHDILAQVLPVGPELDFSKLQLKITTEDMLPYQKIALRKSKRDKLIERQNSAGIDTTGFKMVKNPYRMFSKPVLDISTSARWDNSDSEIQNSTNINGRSDLLGFSADYGLQFGYDDKQFEAPDVLRMTLTKKAYDEPMPLGIREVKIGDVGAATPTLIKGSNSGRGVTVNSRAFQKRKGVFDEIIVEGYAQPGWEVELYRGSELLEFGKVGENGIYRFENVQLLSGGNRIKVLLHGPEGQLEERIEDYSIGNLLAPGSFEYQASIVDTESNLVVLDHDAGGTSRTNRDDLGIAYSGSARMGVNRWMSVFATGSNSATRLGKRKYATLGTDLSLGPVKASIEGYRELDSHGHAIDTRIATSVMGWRVNLKTQFLRDFESDAAGFGDSAKVFDFNGSVSKSFNTDFGRLQVRGSASHEEEKDESSSTSFRLNKSLAFNKQTYGNRLTARYTDHDLTRVDGLFNASHRFGRKLSARTRLSYDVKPEFNFNQISTDVTYRHSKDLNMGLNVSQSLENSQTAAGANVSYDFKKFLGSVGTRWRRGEGFDFTVRASTSLAPYGIDDSYIASSKSLKGKSALNSRVFLDRNLNAVFDEGDEPIEEAMYLIDRKDGDPSDMHGYSRNVEGSKNDYSALHMDKESLENPFYESYYPGYEVLLRPGVKQRVDYALVETGLIDGTAYFDDGRPVPGLALQLLNGEGEVLKETLTFFDGYYSFEFVKPGTYIVRADPALELNLPQKVITISTDALFAYGANVKLLEKGGLAPSEVEVSKRVVQKNVSPILAKLVQLQSKLRGATDDRL